MRFVEHGNRFGAPYHRVSSRWLKVGPLLLEAHWPWFRLGLCAGPPGYVGVYLGFIVVTVGRRAWKGTSATKWLPLTPTITIKGTDA